VRVIADVYVIQNNGILDVTVVSDKGFLEDYGILYRAVDNTAAGNQAVLNLRSNIILRRR